MSENIQSDIKLAPAPALTEHYHKARKLYALASGILLLWELVGIELEPTPIESLKVKLLSPEAVPVILFSLVIYFAFRFIIEWSQCDSYRRQFLASRVDYYAAHVVGFAALSIYAFQEASTFRFYDYFALFPLASKIPIVLVYAAIGFQLIKRTLLQIGTFQPSTDNKIKYKLDVHTIRLKIQFSIMCTVLVLSATQIYLLWKSGGGIAVMAAPLALLFAGVSAAVWVLWFHKRYQLDTIPPAPPTGLRVD